jgi:hypothetical protein
VFRVNHVVGVNPVVGVNKVVRVKQVVWGKKVVGVEQVIRKKQMVLSLVKPDSSYKLHSASKKPDSILHQRLAEECKTL